MRNILCVRIGALVCLIALLIAVSPSFVSTASAEVDVDNHVNFDMQQPQTWFAVFDDRASMAYMFVVEFASVDSVCEILPSFDMDIDGNLIVDLWTSTPADGVYLFQFDDTITVVPIEPEYTGDGHVTFRARISAYESVVTNFKVAYGNSNPFVRFVLNDIVDNRYFEAWFTGQVDYTSLIQEHIRYNESWFSMLEYRLTEILGSIREFFTIGFPEWMNSIFSSIETGFNSVSDKLTAGFDSVVSKLDEFVNGSAEQQASAAERAEEASGAVTDIKDSSSDLKENIGGVESFEREQFGVLDSNIDSVIGGASLNQLTAPLLFVSAYADKITAGIPYTYLIVFTFPVFLGVLLFILSHAVRPPAPDTSGDLVTRETFTTRYYTDRHGRDAVSHSRTITQSHEIGREKV